MKNILGFLAVLYLLVSTSCTNDKNSIIFKKTKIINENFLTEELQSKLSPNLVYSILKKRNEEYVSNHLTIRNTSERIRKASIGQRPAAVVLSCLDSGVSAEDIFHSGIGDLSVVRVAGNVCNNDILGSLEFACKASGAKVIVILGHEHCDAIGAAVNNVELGNITGLLSKIKPAIARVPDYNITKSSENPEYLEAVTKANVLQVIDNIRRDSPILREMEKRSSIKIVGGEYHMKTGKVEFLTD